MDIYHIWCDLKPGIRDTDFTNAAKAYLDTLANEGYLGSFRIMRRKLGLGGPADFHLMLEFEDLDKLDNAFRRVAGSPGRRQVRSGRGSSLCRELKSHQRQLRTLPGLSRRFS